MTQRKAFLESMGIPEQISGMVSNPAFRQVFDITAPIQGRGDAPLLALSKSLGMDAVTMEKRLFNYSTLLLTPTRASMCRLGG